MNPPNENNLGSRDYPDYGRKPNFVKSELVTETKPVLKNSIVSEYLNITKMSIIDVEPIDYNKKN